MKVVSLLKRDSTRKQLPGQSIGLSRYAQLIPTSPEEGYTLLPFLLCRICSERRGGMSHTYLCKPSSVFIAIKLSTTAVFSQGDRTFDQAEHTYTCSFLTLIQCPPGLCLYCRKPQEGCLIPFPKEEQISRHSEQLQLQARGMGSGGKKQTKNPNSAEREGTLLTLRGFEGDPEESTSQQVLGSNPLPSQLHLAMLFPSPYWYK